MADLLDGVEIPQRPCPPARCSVEQWEAEAAGLDHMKGDWNEHAVEIADARCAWQNGRQGRFGGHAEAHRLAGLGLDFDAIARVLRASIQDVARQFCKADADVQAFIEAERILRTEGCPSQAEIAGRTGLSRTQVQVLCTQLGIKSEQTASMEAGGGRTISAEQYERIRELKEAGTSSRRIGAIVGVKPATVRRICTRKGWVAK
jgi:DNA invertase Pin-like site-specific DNA recombinase